MNTLSVFMWIAYRGTPGEAILRMLREINGPLGDQWKDQIARIAWRRLGQAILRAIKCEHTAGERLDRLEEEAWVGDP